MTILFPCFILVVLFVAWTISRQGKDKIEAVTILTRDEAKDELQCYSKPRN